MIGMLVGTAAGALTFKLGMDAQQMSSEGKNFGEIAWAMPFKAVEHVKDTVEYCGRALGLVNDKKT